MADTTSDHLDLSIRYRNFAFGLNPMLVAKQNRTAEQVAEIKALHQEMIDLLYKFVGVTDQSVIRSLADEVEQIEFRMQDAWGWDRDAKRHTHWLNIPGCTCPRQANYVLGGHPARLIARNCPIFGGATRTDEIVLIPTDLAEAARTLPGQDAGTVH